jgi:hypothetical protein
MVPHSLERKFLEEFLVRSANRRGYTPIKLKRCLDYGWIVPAGFDEGNFPLYEITQAGREQLTRDKS